MCTNKHYKQLMHAYLGETVKESGVESGIRGLVHQAGAHLLGMDEMEKNINLKLFIATTRMTIHPCAEFPYYYKHNTNHKKEEISKAHHVEGGHGAGHEEARPEGRAELRWHA